MPDGTEAVLVINLSEQAQDVSVALKDLGLGDLATVYNLYTHAAEADVSTTLEVKGLASHDSVFYKLGTKQRIVVA
jgi:hypothetical protein